MPDSPQTNPTRFLLLLLAILPSCIAERASFLRVPLTAAAPDSGEVAVDLDLADVRNRMPKFDADRLAIYQGGRMPVPHQILDRTGDGNPDTVRVQLTAPGLSPTLVLVSPSDGQITDLSSVPVGHSLQLDWTKAR